MVKWDMVLVGFEVLMSIVGEGSRVAVAGTVAGMEVAVGCGAGTVGEGARVSVG